MKEVLERYKSDPYFAIKAGLSNGSIIIIKFNVFKDKKQNYAPVMRPRYVLFDDKNNRLSLKTLNLKSPVEFEEVHLTEDTIELIDCLNAHSDRTMLIHRMFGNWVNKNFQTMINSGDYKITSLESVPPPPRRKK